MVREFSSIDDGTLELGKLEENAFDNLKSAKTQSVVAANEEGRDYPNWKRVILIMISLYISLFLISLDRTIISTAIPQITNTFHSIGDIGWYESAYMMTACAFQLFFGRIYTFYPSKWIFQASIVLFELGSLVSGVAQSSPAFIVGRAVSGIGSAGIFSGSIVIMVDIIPLQKRPMYQGFMGVVFLIATIIGPLLGGAFTTKLSWRWCFYVNIPLGFIAIILILLFLKLPNIQKKDEDPIQKLSLLQKFNRLDPIGTACFLPGIVCLLLALQWGGSSYSWNDARIIVLFVLFGLLMICFVGVQIWKQENATLPPRILKYRSVTSSCFFAFCISGSMIVLVCFLPVWFQAIQGVDAVESGIRLLPYILATVVSSILAGGLVSILGYYTPVLIACSVVMSIGAGLITTFTVDINKSKWIGYQILFGFGIGLGQQQAGLAAQTVLPAKDVPTGVSVKFFGQQLGGAVFASIAQNVLSNKLVSGLSSLPNLDATEIVNMGATEIRDYVEPGMLDTVLEIYNDALTSVFKVSLTLAALSVVGALLTEWKSVKGKKV